MIELRSENGGHAETPLFIFGFAASHYALRKRNEKTVMTAKNWRADDQGMEKNTESGPGDRKSLDCFV